MKYLLDLNQTLVDREKDAPRIRPFELQIECETYRQWLVEILCNSYVILITARPVKYKQMTLERILTLTNWRPQEAYFAEIKTLRHLKKEHLLRKYILPRYSPAELFGVESNPKTRAVYSNYGIAAAPAIDENGVKISL